MVTVVGIRFKKAGKIYYFDPDNNPVKSGDFAIVETARGVEFGEAVVGPKEVSEDDIIAPLKKVLRVANEEDKTRNAQNVEKEKQAFDICIKKIAEHGLSMKLVDVEYTFDNNKVIFYFTADGRVDFRELVKDLASIFKTRIELRQIGVRDEAKMVGGLGPCGRPLCCASFLGEFEPVSIKMAKEQSLSLNPTKISGICGRLMCCLKYEQDAYEIIRKQLPRVGSIVNTPDGQGEVVENSVVKECVKVKLTAVEGDEDPLVYPITQVTIIKGSTEGEVIDENITIEQDVNVTPEEIHSILEDN
jgi:Uncharacterized homolog of PSP1